MITAKRVQTDIINLESKYEDYSFVAVPKVINITEKIMNTLTLVKYLWSKRRG